MAAHHRLVVFRQMEVAMKARRIRTLSLALVVFVFCPLWGVQAAKTKAKAKDKEAPPPAAAV